MNDILQTIKDFLVDYKLNDESITILVAFSGGFDSMCLLHALKTVSCNKIIAIHLNHKWRGKESDFEELKCKKFCDLIGVNFYSESLSKDCHKTETAAREARYNFFYKCAEKYNSKVVFTAHNMNDNSETVLYRIAKGTGIHGLQGISENRDIFYRPLLSILRENIEKYCFDNNLEPNIDSSNNEIKYKRNYIRNKLLPDFKELNPFIIEKIDSLSKLAIQNENILKEYIDNIYKVLKLDNNKYSLNYFKNLSADLKTRIIYDLFLKYNLEYDKLKINNILNIIINCSDSNCCSKVSLTTNLSLIIKKDYFEIKRENDFCWLQMEIDGEGSFENDQYILKLFKYTDKINDFPSDKDNVCYVDLSDFKINFNLRSIKNGDFIYPLGLNGKQKIKKYLNNKKISSYDKCLYPCLALDNEILWAIGLGISDKIKVKDNPTHCIIFKKKEVNF